VREDAGSISPLPEASAGELKVASQGMLKRALCKKLAQLRECDLIIIEGPETLRFGDAGPLKATIRINDPQMWGNAALNGSVGVAESFMDGQWLTDDLVSLIRIFVRNRDVLDSVEFGLAKFGQVLLRRWHALRRNTQTGSRKNIAEHYDLSNALFKTFLDPTMMYSSAIYASREESLEQAMQRKLQRICEKLALSPEDHLCEIGTGWGGLALYAAQKYGCRVSTTTISEEQYQLARTRVEEAGMSARVSVLKQDYRELQGSFSKVVSIEMIEAIGHQYLATYFGKISSLLRPDGLALIQAITIPRLRRC
jgi:cyclopropane-fatty-acyl-phospholipid synthase